MTRTQVRRPLPGRFDIGVTIIAFGICLIGLLWSGVVLKIRAEEKAEISDLMKDTANLARAVEEHAVRTVREADQVLLSLLSQIRLQGSKPDLRQLIEDGPILSRIYTYLSIIDEHGNLAASNQQFKPVNLSDREYFKVHVAADIPNQPFIGKPDVGRVSGKTFIQVSRRINKPDLSFGGVAVVAIDPDYLTQFYSQLDIGKKGVATLVGRDGIVRAQRAGSNVTATPDVKKWSLFKHLETSKSGSYLATNAADGLTRIFSYRTLPDHPLVVVVGVAMDDALAVFYRRSRNYQQAAALASLVILGFTGFLLLLVSRRKRAEAGRAQLAAIVQSSDDAIISITPDGVILTWNEGARRLFGHTAMQAIGQPFTLLYPATEYPKAWSDLEAVKRGERHYEAMRVRCDGGLIPVSVTAFPIQDANGKITGIGVSYRNIAERKKAEAVQAELSAIVEQSNDVIISRALDGRILTWNPAAERLFGWSAADAIGQSVSIFIPPERTGESARNQALVQTDQPVPAYDTVRLARDGRRIDVSLTHSPIKDERGETVSVALVLRDISKRKRAEEALRNSEQRFRAFFDHAGVGIAMRPARDRHHPWVQVNDHFCKLLGYTRDELLRLSTADITPPNEQQGAVKDNQRLLSGEIANYSREKQVMRKDGSWIWVDLAVTALPDAEGSPRDLLAVYQDITERKKAEAVQAELSAIVEQSNDAIVSRSTDGKFQSWNKGAERMFGYSAVEAIGRPVSMILPPEERSAVEQKLQQTLRGEDVPPYETRRVTKDGRIIDVLASVSPVKDRTGSVTSVSIIFHDITERKKSQERIAYLSQYDALTGLPNRSLFQDRLELAIAHARRRNEVLGVLLVNLDRFKKVNESLGHEAGDELLRKVASRLKSSLREVDTIARLGGNDYAVLVEGIKATDDVTAIADKLIQMLASPFDMAGQVIFVSASVGIAVCSNGDCVAGKLLEGAEIAMSRAKQDGGGDHSLFQDEPITLSGKRLTFETRLRYALENRELAVHYQPKVSLLTGGITGAEALLRWNSPQLGHVSPAEFIPIAEETGLIVPMGAWILEAACTQAARWRRQGHDLNIAVNLSPRQFRQKDLVSMVAEILERSGLEAQRLELEITEGTAMKNAEQTIGMLNELHRLGVKFAVDDFGTGYSSLGYLKRFPLHCLKIDRSFVSDAVEDPNSKAIVRATLALAHSLNLKVVAEGVETEALRDFLAEAGCDEYQGYFFSRPLPAMEFSALLQRSREINLPHTDLVPAPAERHDLDPTVSDLGAGRR